jgi:uncharacterized protein (DUF1501 family)
MSTEHVMSTELTSHEEPNNEPNNASGGLSRRQMLALGAGVAGAATIGPSLSGLTSAAAAARKQQTKQVNPPPGSPKKILVLLTLYGGNDGLNTVVPLADSAYLAARGDLAIKPEQAIGLDATRGLHPSMKATAELFKQGRVAIVQSVGYTSPNRSHFRSMDIWQTAAPESFEFTGWLGRWFDATGADPLKMIHMGASTPRAFLGQKGSGSTVAGGRINFPGGPAVESLISEMYRPGAGSELGTFGARIAASGADQIKVKNTYGPILATLAKTTNAYASLEGGAAALGTDGAKSGLGRNLDAVSALIKSGAPTQVYSVQLGGFDTHAAQLDQHARLLATVDKAVSDFMTEMSAHPNGAGVTVMAYSEFGRRVIANGSNGTDHGTASNVMLYGPQVKGGWYGTPPDLAKLDGNGDLIPTVDFRSIYGAVLGQVLGVDQTIAISKTQPPIAIL